MSESKSLVQPASDADVRDMFTTWAQTYYRNAASYTQRDFDIGLLAWKAAKNSVQPAKADADELRRAVRYFTTALNEREWAEWVSTDPDARDLESAITDMHNELTEALDDESSTAIAQPAKTTTQQLKDIYAFLASTAPEGIADEAFRNIPNSILPDSWRTEQLSLHAVKGDTDGERLGLAQQDRRAGGRIDESLTQTVQPKGNK